MKNLSVLIFILASSIILTGCDKGISQPQKIAPDELYDELINVFDESRINEYYMHRNNGYKMTYTYFEDYSNMSGSTFTEKGSVSASYNFDNDSFVVENRDGDYFSMFLILADFSLVNYINNYSKDQFVEMFVDEYDYQHFWYKNPYTYKSIRSFENYGGSTSIFTISYVFYDYGLLKSFKEIMYYDYGDKGSYSVTLTASFKW